MHKVSITTIFILAVFVGIMHKVSITTIFILAVFVAVLAVDYCNLCALGSCTGSISCKDEDLENAIGCISFYINYREGLNLSYAGCWERSLGTCEELIDYEKQQGYDAVCSVCYKDNCNADVGYLYIT